MNQLAGYSKRKTHGERVLRLKAFLFSSSDRFFSAIFQLEQKTLAAENNSTLSVTHFCIKTTPERASLDIPSIATT